MLASISLMSSIAGSVAKVDKTYSLQGACVCVYSNNLEGVAFASSRTFTQESVPREGTMHCNDKFE